MPPTFKRPKPNKKKKGRKTSMTSKIIKLLHSEKKYLPWGKRKSKGLRKS